MSDLLMSDIAKCRLFNLRKIGYQIFQILFFNIRAGAGYVKSFKVGWGNNYVQNGCFCNIVSESDCTRKFVIL